ncbi:MAG: cytochrome c biogenesis protein CcsA [Candidatus Hydrogenedentota bacterium]
MTVLTLSVLVAGALAHLAATVAAVQFLLREKEAFLHVSRRLALIGMGLFLAVFVLRWTTWGRLPMTTVPDALVVFVIFATLVMFASTQRKTKAVSSFYLPPILALAVLCAVTAPGTFTRPPKALDAMFLAGHVSLAFLAYAFFLGASVTSVAYLFQARHLKNHNTRGLFLTLPSLERLDKSLYLLIRHGYIVFALTLIVGGVWVHIDAERLGPRWYLAPKILQSVAMVAFYALIFHARQLGLLRGRKLAFAVLIGFSAMFGIYLLRALLGVSYYHFWESTAWAL